MPCDYKKIFQVDKSKPVYHFLPIQQVPTICCPKCFSIKASMCSDCGTFMCTNMHKFEAGTNMDVNKCFYYYDNKRGEVRLGHDPFCQKKDSAIEIAEKVVELLRTKKTLETNDNSVDYSPDALANYYKQFHKQFPSNDEDENDEDENDEDENDEDETNKRTKNTNTSLVDLSGELEQKASIYMENPSKLNPPSWDSIKEYIRYTLAENHGEDTRRSLQELQVLIAGLEDKLPLKVKSEEDITLPTEIIYERPVDANATYVNIRSRTMGQGDHIRGDLRIAPDTYTEPHWFQVCAKPERDLRKSHFETDGSGRPQDNGEFLNLS